MRLMFVMLAVIVAVTGCGFLGNGGSPGPENTEPIESLGAKIGEGIKLDQKGRVVEIDLSDKLVDDEDLKVIARYQHLQKLKLAKTGVTDAGLADLLPLKNLRVIMLSNTAVTSQGLQQLAVLPSLREVFVWPMKITKKEYEDLKAKLPRVKVHD